MDAISFLISARVLWGIEGDWSVANASLRQKSLWGQAKQMVQDGASYIIGTSFWPLIFMKCSAGFVYGGNDVLNVSFSEQGLSGDLEEEDKARISSERLGLLFCSVGIGCFIGPIVCDRFTSMDSYKSILSTCVVSFFLMASGLFGMAYFTSFKCTVFYTAVRASGSSIQWIYSSLLLQVRMNLFTHSNHLRTLR